jgi:hypothetical protein
MILAPLNKACRFILLLALLFPAANAAAQIQVNVSENEKAIFAFHRLSRQEPDFKMIGRSYDEFMNAPLELKEEVLEATTLRLKTGFGMHDLDKDFLRITTKILVQVRAQQGETPPLFIFHFPNHSKDSYVPYFPYPLGDTGWIALLVEDLPQFSSIPLTAEQYAFIKQYLSEDDTPYEMMLHMRVRPKSADGTAPVVLDGVEQWMMMGDVAYITCSTLTETPVKLWEYSAPWYLTDAEKELLPLLSGQ